MRNLRNILQENPVVMKTNFKGLPNGIVKVENVLRGAPKFLKLLKKNYGKKFWVSDIWVEKSILDEGVEIGVLTASLALRKNIRERYLGTYEIKWRKGEEGYKLEMQRYHGYLPSIFKAKPEIFKGKEYPIDLEFSETYFSGEDDYKNIRTDGHREIPFP